VWAIFQQFILQSYFYLRLEKLISARAAVLLSAGLFCLVHIPNPVLIAVCLVAGYLACEVFRRNRNIYALGVAHAVLGLTIAVTVPDDIQRHMRVGIGYYHYHAQRVIAPRG
jgi:membrane protease YdiL (CAAX protease family)